jgi:hypothetical protein
MSKNTGGPAFPVTPTDRSGQIADTQIGMTLRDYFASDAMAALLSLERVPGMRQADALIAANAYRLADAMIAERDNG